MCLISQKNPSQKGRATRHADCITSDENPEAISLSTKTLGRYVVTVNQWNHPTKMSPPTIKDDKNMSSGRSMDVNS
jgi:hypothetical protein